MPRSSISGLLAILIAASFLAAPTHAADPQPYKVDMGSTGNDDMDATLKATSDLQTLRTSAPVGPFALIGRARSDVDRLKTVLESYGYYQSYVSISIDGLPIDAPGLGDELSARPKADDAHVNITFSLGPVYHLRNITIDGDISESDRKGFALHSGDPAVAADVLAAGTRLQTSLQDQGYAFAKVDPPSAQEIPDERVLDVSFHVVTGQKVQIGPIHVQGLKLIHESFVRRRLLIHQGEEYGASKVENARKDLLSLGVFTSVTVQVDTKPDSSGQVPITFGIRERRQHAVSISGAYSTDLGGSTGVTWTNRNISGRADQLSLSASVINLGGTVSKGIGYDLNGKYLIPEFAHRDQSLQFGLQAVNQFLAAYDQKALIFGTTLSRKLSSIWRASIGITAITEEIGQEGTFTHDCQTLMCEKETTYAHPPFNPDPAIYSVNQLYPPYPPGCTEDCTQTIFTQDRLKSHFTLFALPLSLTYDTTGLSSPIEDPTQGIRASFSETPTLSVGTKNAQFFITQAIVAYYLDLHGLRLNPDPGRSVLALRALAGIALGASQFSLPPDQRFYAGGSGTIRGYAFQSVGPTFPDGNPIGGTAINAGSAEFRQRIGKSFGFAVFVDAGQVSSNVNPLNATLRFGTGAGVRYYTPIGPIRVDVGLPINRRFDDTTHRFIDDAFVIYIGLGQAF